MSLHIDPASKSVGHDLFYAARDGAESKPPGVDPTAALVVHWRLLTIHLMLARKVPPGVLLTVMGETVERLAEVPPAASGDAA